MKKHSLIQTVTIILIIIWYWLALLDIIGVITIGNESLKLSWLIYTVVWLFTVLGIRRYFMDKQAFTAPLLLLLVQTVAFSLTNIFQLENQSGWYNRAEHFLGTLIVILIASVVLERMQGFRGIRRFYQILSITGLTLIFTTFNELFELGIDYFTGSTSIGPGLWDTKLDLTMNSLAIIVYLLYKYTRNRSADLEQSR
ncbi:MAG: hypothetical protein V1838_02575 [Patescibacteria group bacterium]